MKRLFLILLLCSQALAWTTSLRSDIPANDDDPTQTPEFIRDTKDALIERLDVCMYFTQSAANTYDATDTGKFRYMIFREPNSISSVNADEFCLFTKDVNSVAELHWRDEEENERQFTSEGDFLLDEDDLTLNNNSYLIADNAAGNGTINIIKVNTSDEIILGVITTLPDNSKLTTSGDPNEDNEIVCKKYVVDQVAAKNFGTPTTTDTNSNSLVGDEVYLAECDGFLLYYTVGVVNTTTITIGTSNPPNIDILISGDSTSAYGSGATAPIPKDYYVTVTGIPSSYYITWVPVGTGGLIKQ